MGSAAAGPCLDLEPAGGRRLSRQASWTAISAPRPQPLSLRHPHSVAREPRYPGSNWLTGSQHQVNATLATRTVPRQGYRNNPLFHARAIADAPPALHPEPDTLKTT